LRAKYQGSVAPEEAKLPIIKVNRTDKAKYIFFNKLTFSKKSFDCISYALSNCRATGFSFVKNKKTNK